MGEHGHDIHFMLIVLVLTFFIVTLSINQLDPSFTANVIKRSPGENDPIINFLKSSGEKSSFNIFDSKRASALQLDLTGKNVDEEVQPVDIIKCDWVNVDNKYYAFVKGLTGKEACKSLNYNLCVMTNKETKTSYFASMNAECSNLQIELTSNKFGSCNEVVFSTTGDCSIKSLSGGEPLAGDVIESSYTSVLCCI
ncbi:MAG: hypothetical protein KJ583_00395 [Nanoarchaeota archaeon]|nr:hypothetical protein [Nanoarchaeota archaeon]MBU1269045.1 hypothetical protein [Nanoarchaeota archaeon]MBU1603748.1 hypothetical protein [Nanoarchaeota archaeon]MBU2443519.1 hypothetical protein [Nanoarchaeota archaeon]